MKGSIEYLLKLRSICHENKGDCKKCPLGKQKDLEKTICPRLTHPETWTDDKVLDFVRI